MNLIKATGTIGGLTLVSRIAGFAREMLMSRVMGASWQADAFFVAFRLPNTFRRLFGEGAFSAGFVPLYAQRLQGDDGEARSKSFAEEVLGVFVPALVTQLVGKCRSRAGVGQFSNSDNMAVVGVLSTMLVHAQLIRRQPDSGPRVPLRTLVDALEPQPSGSR